MKRRNLLNVVVAAASAAALLIAPIARAVPVAGLYIEDPRCDAINTQSLPHELGELTTFPLNESFFSTVTKSTTYICVPDDLIVNDWEVQIRNTSGIAWNNLFFVANKGMTIGNADGNMVDTVNAPGVTTDAFRIDGTVTAGVNNNLISESGIVDEIFSPGETWTFLVTNFADPNGTSPPPLFNTPGLFAGSAPVVAAFPDTASILATPVPEPSSAGLLTLGAAAMFLRRPRSSRTT